MAQPTLTPGQTTFIRELSARTGLAPALVAGWVYNEQNGPAAQYYQNRGYNNWLNIGNTDTLVAQGGSNQQSSWNDPQTAADATAAWLTGKSNAGGYGYAAPAIQAFARGAQSGDPLPTQIYNLQHSGWASGGYPNLPSIVSSFSGSPIEATAAPPVTTALSSSTAPVTPIAPAAAPAPVRTVASAQPRPLPAAVLAALNILRS